MFSPEFVNDLKDNLVKMAIETTVEKNLHPCNAVAAVASAFTVVAKHVVTQGHEALTLAEKKREERQAHLDISSETIKIALGSFGSF